MDIFSHHDSMDSRRNDRDPHITKTICTTMHIVNDGQNIQIERKKQKTIKNRIYE